MYIFIFIYIGSEWARRGFVMLWYVTVATPNSQPPKIFLAFLTLEVLLTRKVCVLSRVSNSVCNHASITTTLFLASLSVSLLQLMFSFLYIFLCMVEVLFTKEYFIFRQFVFENSTLFSHTHTHSSCCMRMIHQWLNMLCILQLMFKFNETSTSIVCGLSLASGHVIVNAFYWEFEERDSVVKC